MRKLFRPNTSYGTSDKKRATVESRMDSCDWTRMGNEDGKGLTGADAAASWQQCYTWCAPYSHPHPHQHHPQHPRQYQGSQYQQLPGSGSCAATNASTHYPPSQQHHPQLQSTQPPPLEQQQHLHPIKGQGGLRRTVPYDGSGIQFACNASILAIDPFRNGKNETISCGLKRKKVNDLRRLIINYTSDKYVFCLTIIVFREAEVDYISTETFSVLLFFSWVFQIAPFLRGEFPGREIMYSG